MTHAETIPLARRPELVLSPLAEGGRYLLTDPRAGASYRLGQQEAFLLAQMDGRRTAAEVCTAFAEHFGESLSGEELDEFLDLAAGRGLLEAAGGPEGTDVPEGTGSLCERDGAAARRRLALPVLPPAAPAPGPEGSPESVSVPVDVALPTARLSGEVQVPAGPTTPAGLLPVFRSLAETLVRSAVQAALAGRLVQEGVRRLLPATGARLPGRGAAPAPTPPAGRRGPTPSTWTRPARPI